MNKAEKEATEKLRWLVNGNCPDCQVSISYTGKKPGKAELEEMEKFSKNLRSRMAKDRVQFVDSEEIRPERNHGIFIHGYFIPESLKSVVNGKGNTIGFSIAQRLPGNEFLTGRYGKGINGICFRFRFIETI